MYETNYVFCVFKNDHRDMLILVRRDVFAKDIFGDIFSVSRHIQISLRRRSKNHASRRVLIATFPTKVTVGLRYICLDGFNLQCEPEAHLRR